MSTAQDGAVDAPSDYERVGGGRAVRAVVDDFYQRVLADPSLAPFFTGVDITGLKRHQVLLVSQVIGGPAQYDGRELDQAHAHLDIADDDFDAVVVHLVASLQGAGVPDDVIGRVGEALGAMRPAVVTADGAPEDGAP
jgi:hemoglobin